MKGVIVADKRASLRVGMKDCLRAGLMDIELVLNMAVALVVETE
jgi:hypothetical protein